MFGSSVLDMAIGLMFFYFLLSTLCSTLNEWVAATLRWRSKTLEQGVRQLLGEGDELCRKLYAHPLINGLTHGGGRPSYIPSHTFAAALLDLLSPKAEEPTTEGRAVALRAHVAELADGPTKSVLQSLIDDASDDLERARANIARWFDDSMDRVSDFYKRRVRRNILLLALIVSTALNGDTLVLANSLWRDALLRESMAGAAKEASRGMQLSAGEIQREVEKLRPPLGWRLPLIPARGPMDPPPGLPFYRDSYRILWLAAKAAGLLLTALAVSLGAPFWFDLLNRVSNLRSVSHRPDRNES